MSSRPRNRLLGSSVFRLTLFASLTCLAATFFIFGAIYFVKASQLRAEMAREVEAQWFEFEAIYAEEGLDGLAENLSEDGERIWDPDVLYGALEEGWVISRLVNFNDDTLAGLHQLDPPGGLVTSYVDFDSLAEDPMLSLRHEIGEDHELVVARYYPQWLGEMRDLLEFSIYLLLIGLVPIALVTAWWLSRTVFARLNSISATAESIGEGSLTSRVPLKGSGDEFDRLSSAVNDMLDRITALTRNIENVSVGVAHDLKTPVSNIAGRLQLIERDAGNTDAVTVHVEAANQHIETLLRALNALLRLGEVEAGKRRAAFQPIDLSGLVGDFAESFLPVVEDADKHLAIDIAGGISVTGDPDLLTQMLTNLLENFVEHGRDGGRAKLVLARTGKDAILRLGDDGPGIPAHRREQIFERFYRLDASRSAAGNGLGLSLVKSISELHFGGCELIAGEPGAVFEIRLPLG